jgi:hypothetical protein
VLTTTSLTRENLADFRVLVLPSAITLTDANVEVVRDFLDGGGKVIATGGTGLRHGPDGLLLKRETNALEALDGHPNLKRVGYQPAAPFWLDRSADTRDLSDLLDWAEARRRLWTDAPASVTVTLFRSRLAGSGTPGFALDLNNCAFSVEDDRFIPTPSFEVALRLPEKWPEGPVEVTCFQPDQPDRPLPGENIRREGRRLTLTIPSFRVFKSLYIRPANAR